MCRIDCVTLGGDCCCCCCSSIGLVTTSLTNKLLAMIATDIYSAFPIKLLRAAQKIGNPVRDDIRQIQIPELGKKYFILNKNEMKNIFYSN